MSVDAKTIEVYDARAADYSRLTKDLEIGRASCRERV